MTLPKTGNYRGATLLINEVDVSASVDSIQFLDLTDTLFNWEMVVCFSGEPDGVDTYNLMGNIVPITFQPNGPEQASVAQYALISNWSFNSITLKPSKGPA
jgi:hypothetical protein